MQTEAQRRTTKKYHKEHLKRIPLSVQKDYYNEILLPAVKQSGETVSGYIKKAAAGRIAAEARESLLEGFKA